MSLAGILVSLSAFAAAWPASAQPAEATTESVEQVKEKGIDGIAVPLVSFSSDLGVGYGVVGGMYIYGPGYRPYRHGIAVQGFFTSRGVQSHYVRYDGPGLLGRQTRLDARLELRREIIAPFFGPGNASAPGSSGDPSDRRFAYQRLSPAGWVRLRGHLLGEDHPLQAYAGYSYRQTRVTPYEDSLLEQTRPPGFKGGPTGQIMLGLLWDRRDNEENTARGELLELSLRAAGPDLASSYRFVGITASVRAFWSLRPERLVLAQRLTFDHLAGDVPFFEWPIIGGLNPGEGIGGMSSVRGVPRNRYTGNTKVLSNTELRFTGFQFSLLGTPVKAGALALLDLGRTWHPGVEDGPWYRWHPGVGAGIRLSRRSAVLRFDYAVALEDWRQGVYVTFGQMF